MIDDTLIAPLSDAFGQVQQWLFEAVVQPLVFEAGMGNLLEDAYTATGWLLVGLIQMVVLLAGIGPLQRWRPVERARDTAGVWIDVLYTVIHRLGLFRVAMFFSVEPLLDEVFGQVSVWGVNGVQLDGLLAPLWPGVSDTAWASFLVYLLVFDLLDYWIHRGQHHANRWWALHAVHHSVRRMTGFNGWMKHPLHLLLEAAGGMLPLLLVGIPQAVVAVLAFAVAIQLLLQHANVAMRMGPLRQVFAWTPVHRFHHMKYGTAGDVNFGLFFTCWDRMLGTSFDAPAYRMRGEDLGIGSRPDYPQDYLAQLCEPFRAEEGVRAPETPEGLRRPGVNRAR